VPGTLTFFVLMMTTIYGAIFLTLEKRQGMIRRQAMLPLSRGRIFAGKLVGRMLMAGAQIVIYLLAGRLLFGVSFGDSSGGLLLVLFAYAAACSGLSLLLGAVLSTPEQASTVGWIVGMVLGALGGCWWPSEVMPRWLWSAAHVLPTAWAMDAFHSLISFGRGIEAVFLPAAVLLGFAALFSVLGARFLRWA
jgi:ABC-2 type transport system permease protein